jgi:enoyl-CoA hydratase/carnithine racemase
MSIRTDRDERGCRTIWIDRPTKRNALDEGMPKALAQAIDETLADDATRLVLLRSTSPVFNAGADLNEWADISPDDASRLSLLGGSAFQALADLPVPVIAVLEGPALGGGLELVLACDIRMGTDASSVGFPEPRLGNSPAWGGISRLVEISGRATARNLLLTGEIVEAEEAHRIGLLQRLCRANELTARLAGIVKSVLACDQETVRNLKALLCGGSQSSAVEEATMAGYNATRLESRERKAAFLAQQRQRRMEGIIPG